MDFSFKDMFRNHVEQVSNGKNTVIYDKFGNPNIMYVLRKFNNRLLTANVTDTAYPFIIGDKEVNEIFISKYHNGIGEGGVPISYPAMFPAHCKYRELNDLVKKKGSGWKFFSAVEFRTLILLGQLCESTPVGKYVGDEPLDGVAGCGPNGYKERYRKPGTHNPKYNHDGTQFGVTGLMQDRWIFTPGAIIAPDGQFWATGKEKDHYTNDPTWFGSRENMTPTGIYFNTATGVSTTPYTGGDYSSTVRFTKDTFPKPSITRSISILLGFLPIPQFYEDNNVSIRCRVGYGVDHFCTCGGTEWDHEYIANDNSHLNTYFSPAYCEDDDAYLNAGGHAFRTTYIPELDTGW